MLEYDQLLSALDFLEMLWVQGCANRILAAQKSSAQWIQWCKHALTPSGGASCSVQLPFPRRVSQYLFLSISFIPDIYSNTK